MTVQHITGTLSDYVHGEYILVDFSADWCPPCKVMKPRFASLSEDVDLKALSFGEVDVDAEQALSEKYKVSSIPTFVLLSKEGDELIEVERWIGAQQDMLGFKQKLLQLTAPIA